MVVLTSVDGGGIPFGAVTRLLLVEDDALIATSLQRALGAAGFEVDVEGTVAGARERIAAGLPDLVLLDLGLPDGDGGDLVEELSGQHPRLPIIVVTARDDETEVVVGLQRGAVDYVTKPFRLAELLARIRAQLRLAAAGGPPDPDRAPWVVGDLEVDRAARRVQLAGTEVPLRPREFDVLARLARAAGAVVTREALIEEVWDENWWGSTKTLDVHINNIRRKLGERSGQPSRIVTIRGVGYRLDPR